MLKQRTARLPAGKTVRLPANQQYSSRGKYGLDYGAPPARATTADPLAECLATGKDGKVQRAELARKAKKRQKITQKNIDRLREVIQTLSPPVRDVTNIWLRMIESARDGGPSVTWSAIATAVGIGVPACKGRWRRALQELRDKLPAWRDMFPVNAFCDDIDLYAAALEQEYERRLLEGGGASIDEDESVGDREDDPYPADDGGPFHGLSLKETKERGNARPDAPRSINRDLRPSSMDHFDAVCRKTGQRLYKLSPKQRTQVADLYTNKYLPGRRPTKEERNKPWPLPDGEQFVGGGPSATYARGLVDPENYRRGFVNGHLFKDEVGRYSPKETMPGPRQATRVTRSETPKNYREIKLKGSVSGEQASKVCSCTCSQSEGRAGNVSFVLNIGGAVTPTLYAPAEGG